ncbi:MAG: cell division protein FtsQ/DivIB [Paracoccaceae bacterium]|nr:cell division protein FtsQ/DivIB [Pseudomonadota bacterium]NCW06306.1 FtsQ-type POTRA domain-containing protein [Rhodobacterales bacterium]
MQQIGFPKLKKRDPAPSRLGYKFSRWMLSPFIKKSVFFGMPLIILLLPVFIFLKDQNNKNLVEEIVLDFYRKIIERPEFMLSALSIQGSSDSLNAEIREILGLNFPISSFDLDLADLRNRVLSLPPVETAEVRLEGGSILHVKVKEKVPALLLKDDTGIHVLNKNGDYIRPLLSTEYGSKLPVITGEGAQKAAAEAFILFSALYDKLDEVRGLVLVGGRRWNIVLKSGQVIMLPEKKSEQAVQKILILDKAEKILSRDIAVFDFRLPYRITLRFPENKDGQINSKVIGVSN